MTKRAKDKESDEVIEHAAFILTVLLATINQHIDKAHTYDLVLECLDNDGLVDEESAEELGHMILLTSLNGDHDEIH